MSIGAVESLIYANSLSGGREMLPDSETCLHHELARREWMGLS
jgi:hypothetical protein